MSSKIDAFCPVGIGGTKGIDTTKLKLFIGGLQKHTSKDLYDLFIKYGTIRESVVIRDAFRVRSGRYGFITFESESSVRRTLNNGPIIANEGTRLTVILASDKPRRAHFNVSHGTSGHKPLANVFEKKEINSKKYSMKQMKNKNNKNESTSIGIYTDPSLFPTANIQQIAPAKFNIKSDICSLKSREWTPLNKPRREHFNVLNGIRALIHKPLSTIQEIDISAPHSPSSTRASKSITRVSPPSHKPIKKLSNVKILYKIESRIDCLLSIDWIGVTLTSMIIGIKGVIYKIEMDINTHNTHEIPNVFVLTRPLPNHINIDQTNGRLSPNIADLRNEWCQKGKYSQKIYNLLSQICSIANGASLQPDDILNEGARWGAAYDIVVTGENRYKMNKNIEHYKVFINFVNKRRAWDEKQTRLEYIYQQLDSGLLFN